MSSSAIEVRAGTETQVMEEAIGEHRLWTAVIVQAVEDWRLGTLRARREAQKFLFEDDNDFNRVCASAGLDPMSFRSKLLKVGKKVEMHGAYRNPMVA
jgi:hypothetical protein